VVTLQARPVRLINEGQTLLPEVHDILSKTIELVFEAFPRSRECCGLTEPFD
jgi:hypothetical protein